MKAQNCRVLIVFPVKQEVRNQVLCVPLDRGAGQRGQQIHHPHRRASGPSELSSSLLTLPVPSLQEVKSALEIEKVALETPAVDITLTV
eukprot:755831-Hanusia_phi.AAC.3